MANYASAVKCYQGHYDSVTMKFSATKEIPLCSLRGACYDGDRVNGPHVSNAAAFLYGTGFTLNYSYVPDTDNIKQIRMWDPVDRSRSLRAVANLSADKMTGVNLPYPSDMIRGVVFSQKGADNDSVAYCVLLLSFNSIYSI